MAELAEPITTRERVQRVGVSQVLARGRAALRAWPAVRRFVFVLMVLYVAKQAIYVVAFPPFTGHDEVAHYAYLRTVATEHRVPVLGQDRLPSDLYRYCHFTLNWDPCDPTNTIYRANPPYNAYYPSTGQTHSTGWQYAANHPPLYYILMTPIYWATDGSSPATQQYVLRVAAILFGLLTVFLAYLLVRTLFPGDPFLAITVPAFVALQPQISYEAAMVNNDIVSIAFYSWVLYLLVVGIRDRFPTRICVLTGFAFGLALLSKGTSVTAAAIIAFAIVLTVGLRNVRAWVTRGVITVVPAAALAAPWYAYLYHTYGNFDGFSQVQKIQWWNKPYGTFFGMLFSRRFVSDRFKETWGDFGWRRILFDSTMLWAIALPLIVAVGGLVMYALTVRRTPPGPKDDPVAHLQRWQVDALLTLAATCFVAYLAVIQFGTKFELTQARYYFPAINAAALLLMLGVRSIVPRAYHAYGQAAVFAALVFLNLMIFTQYVIPYFPHW